MQSVRYDTVRTMHDEEDDDEVVEVDEHGNPKSRKRKPAKGRAQTVRTTQEIGTIKHVDFTQTLIGVCEGSEEDMHASVTLRVVLTVRRWWA